MKRKRRNSNIPVVIRRIRRRLRTLATRYGHYNSPSVMLIGVQKGGTTALFDMLMRHPLLQGGIRKELHYFSNDREYRPESIHRYHANFVLPMFSRSNTCFIDATPRYSVSPLYLKRIHAYRPDMKLIFVMREPAKRAFSHWAMQNRRKPNHAWPRETLSFADAIDANFNRIHANEDSPHDFNYIERGVYLNTIKSILNYFPEEQLLLLQNNELKEFSESTSRRIQEFIGVPYHPLPLVDSNKNPKPVEPDEATMQRLWKFYAPHNEELFAFLNKSPNWS